MDDVPDRPAVRLVGGMPEPPARLPGRGWSWSWSWLGLVVIVLAGVLLYAHGSRSGWSVEPAQLSADGTLSVTLVNRGAPVRVTAVRLRDDALAVTAPAALSDEIAMAEAAGVPPLHDPSRLLARGRHTFRLGVRPRCPPAARPDPAAAVLLDVSRAGAVRTAADPVSRPVLLPCTPLQVGAGLSPAPPGAGQVELLLTAHVGSDARPRTLRSLAWPGFRVEAVGAVVPLALGTAGIDETVFFDAAVAPDCGAPPSAGLTAVFDGATLPVRLTGAAATRVRALRALCR